MLAAAEMFGFAMRVITVVVPLAVYFLILGLLNSRRHPQVLSGRQDAALLVVALSPLLVLPMLMLLGMSAWTVALAGALLVAAIRLMTPRGQAWVIYNLSPSEAYSTIEHCLRGLGLDYSRQPSGFDVGAGSIRVSHFPLLRNVTLRLEGRHPALERDFAPAMAKALASSPAETTPMAMTLLLVATAMLVAPLSMFVQQVPTLVRLVTDFVR